jgi:hypothetical protein
MMKVVSGLSDALLDSGAGAVAGEVTVFLQLPGRRFG